MVEVGGSSPLASTKKETVFEAVFFFVYFYKKLDTPKNDVSKNVVFNLKN